MTNNLKNNLSEKNYETLISNINKNNLDNNDLFKYILENNLLDPRKLNFYMANNLCLKKGLSEKIIKGGIYTVLDNYEELINKCLNCKNKNGCVINKD